MNFHINLLPWRLKRHKRQSRLLLWKLSVTLSVAICTAAILGYADNRRNTSLTEKQHNARQLRTELHRLEQQVVRLRGAYKPQETRRPITRETAEHMLMALSRLPLQQGELNEFKLIDGDTWLNGYTENQTEFERLNRFLSESGLFNKVELTRFVPQTDGRIRFEFYLTRKTRE